jgi:cytidyltransferase-like protein
LAALTEAKKLGDVLVVVVATDTTVETLKERKPLFPEEDRRALVEGLKPVDIAILGYEDVGFGFEQVLDDVKPDVVAFSPSGAAAAATALGSSVSRPFWK